MTNGLMIMKRLIIKRDKIGFSVVALTKLYEILTNANFVRSEPDKASSNTIKDVRFYQVPVSLLGQNTNIEVVVRFAFDGGRLRPIELRHPTTVWD
jgi:hypothetical protein